MIKWWRKRRAINDPMYAPWTTVELCQWWENPPKPEEIYVFHLNTSCPKCMRLVSVSYAEPVAVGQ